MKTRILFVSGFVADTYSEIERSFVELCTNTGNDVEYLWLVPEISAKDNRFARPDSAHSLVEPVWVTHLRSRNIQFVVANISKYNFLTNFLLFRRIFHNHTIDAVYTHFGPERFWATFFGKLWGKVTIWNEHWHSLGRRYAPFKRIFYRIFVDEFISVSKYITSTLPLDASVHTLPNAIHAYFPAELNSEQCIRLRKYLGIAVNSTVVLMVAAFRPEKRHMLALDACARVLKVRNDVTFVFLGEGELRMPFLEKVKEQGLAVNIVAPGHVDNVEDYYAIADISMLTSHYEPFGYVVLEAMRYKLPVVAFDSGGPSEVLKNDETGILIRDGDVDGFARRVLNLIESGEDRKRIGQNASRAIEEDYNRERWISRLNTTLKDIVATQRMGSGGSIRRM